VEEVVDVGVDWGEESVVGVRVGIGLEVLDGVLLD
jgi:hypothetical protein